MKLFWWDLDSGKNIIVVAETKKKQAIGEYIFYLRTEHWNNELPKDVETNIREELTNTECDEIDIDNGSPVIEFWQEY